MPEQATFGAYKLKVPPLRAKSLKPHECCKCGLDTTKKPKMVGDVPYYFCSLHCESTTKVIGRH